MRIRATSGLTHIAALFGMFVMPMAGCQGTVDGPGQAPGKNPGGTTGTGSGGTSGTGSGGTTGTGAGGTTGSGSGGTTVIGSGGTTGTGAVGMTGTGAVGGAASACTGVVPKPDQPRRLNRTEMTHLMEDVFGVAGNPFAILVNDRNAKTNSSLSVSTGFIDDYGTAVKAAATSLVATKDPTAACTAAAAVDCIFDALRPLFERAGRRPVSSARSAAMKTLLKSGFDLGLPRGEVVAGAIEAFLLAPETLFVGTNVTSTPGLQRLDDYGVAERLALALWDSVPDEALMAAAAKGELASGAGLDAQIDRMLADPTKGGRYLLSFVEMYLHITTLDAIATKAPPAGIAAATWPGLVADMGRETTRFVQHTFDQNLDVHAFVDGRFAFLNKSLAAHYGVTAPMAVGADLVKVDLPADGPIRGLLTQGTVMIPTHKDGFPEIFRGKEVNRLFRCVELPAPPSDPSTQAAIDAQLADPNQTAAQKYQFRNSNAACVSCHQQMDPFGKAFNQFDEAGRFRERNAAGQVIDTMSSMGAKIIRGPADVTATIRADGGYASCLASYVLGPMIHRDLNVGDAADRCSVSQVLAPSGGAAPQFKDMVKAALKSDALRTRVVAPPL